jgi:hypothetical protein
MPGLFTSRLLPLTGAALLSISLLGPAAQADVIVNGNFTSNTATTSYNGNTIGTSFSGAAGSSNITGWGVTSCLALCNQSLPSSDTFTFLATTGNVGADGVYATEPGLTAPIGFFAGPTGTPPSADAVTADAGISVGAIYQTVTGLTVGDTYLLTFSQATMQADDISNPQAFTAAWQVYFGTGSAANAATSPTVTGTSMYNPGGGSSSWVTDTIALTATAASETLAFFASDSAGQPPFLLLDGVSLTDEGAAVPEPGSLALIAVGLGGLVFARHRRAAI